MDLERGANLDWLMPENGVEKDDVIGGGADEEKWEIVCHE